MIAVELSKSGGSSVYFRGRDGEIAIVIDEVEYQIYANLLRHPERATVRFVRAQLTVSIPI